MCSDESHAHSEGNYCNCSSGDTCDCDCDGGGGDGGALILLVFVLVILVFVGIYYGLKACGKNISRIVSVFFLLLLELAMAVLSMILGNDTYLI